MASNYPHRTSDMLVPRNSEIYQMMDIGDQAVLNAATNGNHGYAANNFGYVQEEPYISERPYCVVLSTPEAFSNIPGGDALHGVLRNAMETRTRSFSGVSSQTTVQFAEVTWQGGQTLSVPSGATRQFGSINHNLYDLRGEEISRMIDIWQTYLLKDPVILHSKIITLDYSGDLLLDEISMACCYFEPDKNFKDIRRACVSLAMMPRNGPQYEMSYNVDDTAGQMRELSLEYTGLFEYNTHAAREIAKSCLKRLPIYNDSAKMAPEGFRTPTARLQSLSSGGIVNQMQQAAKSIQTGSTLY